MIMTNKEIANLKDAIRILNHTRIQLKAVLEIAESGDDINSSLIWDLRNATGQPSEILYNIHRGVYRRAEMSI